jgi:hypothetical protein
MAKAEQSMGKARKVKARKGTFKARHRQEIGIARQDIGKAGHFKAC